MQRHTERPPRKPLRRKSRIPDSHPEIQLTKSVRLMSAGPPTRRTYLLLGDRSAVSAARCHPHTLLAEEPKHLCLIHIDGEFRGGEAEHFVRLLLIDLNGHTLFPEFVHDLV